MKLMIVLTCVNSILAGVSCNSESNRQTGFDSLPADTTPKKEYYNIIFASEKDTTCGMPLSAGIGDTLNWNNKIYGFCSKRCKDAFVEKLKKENKL